MWWGRGNGASTMFVRYMSRERAPNLRKINPKVSQQEAVSIAEGLYNVLKQHGPLTVPHTWTHVKEAGVDGLNSKTHMKIMLKWMRGRNMLKLICNHVGSTRKFLHCTLPEEPQTEQSKDMLEPELQPAQKNEKRKKEKRKKLTR